MFHSGLDKSLRKGSDQMTTNSSVSNGMCTTEPEVINPDLLAFINEAV